jgi:hypothetical protein
MSIKELFYFPKSDRKAILFLVVGIVAMVVVIRWANGLSVSPQSPVKKTQKAQKKANSSVGDANKWQFDDYAPAPVHLSPFDPNTASPEQLLALGLQAWQVKSLLKYRSKGGVFRQPSDFARLHGLTLKQYRQLEPYIRIADDYRPAADFIARERPHTAQPRDTLRFPTKLKPGARVFLNTADTTELKKVPGIGSYFARQIVYYRNRLGGFVSVEQLAEIEDFPTESMAFFALTADELGKIKRININKLTLNELKKHPYIGFYQARAIIDFRRLHGNLQSLDQLKLLKDFSEDKVQRLQPYVEF